MFPPKDNDNIDNIILYIILLHVCGSLETDTFFMNMIRSMIVFVLFCFFCTDNCLSDFITPKVRGQQTGKTIILLCLLVGIIIWLTRAFLFDIAYKARLIFNVYNKFGIL